MSISSPTSTADNNRATWHGIEMASLPEVPSWVEPLGRAGYFAKGVVYFVIGLLAFKLAIGLFGYAAWRLVQAAKDTDGEGHETKGIVKRTGYALSGLAYFALGCFAGSLALGWGAGSSGSGGDSASSLLNSTWGRVILGIAGAVTIGMALYFVYKAYRAKFMSKYNLSTMSETSRKVALHAGRIGLSTRGIAFAIIGGFIIISAVQGSNDGEIAGMSDALAAIATQAYGKILIGVTGFGLMCYAVHMAMMGWFRRFNVA